MGKPLLKIGPLTNLQDARSSAAVGFNLITFSIERGSMKKLPVNMIWSMIQWLSGTSTVLEINRISLEELEEVKKYFTFEYLSFPISEWGPDLLTVHEGIVLRLDSTSSPDTCQQIIAEAGHQEILFELTVPSVEDAKAYMGLSDSLLLNVSDMDRSREALEQIESIKGLSLKGEALEEDGILNYEAIDDWIEVFEEEFDED
ncbi:MAG: hypothetical protein AAFY71_06430 [Bacteroidota bacterium]